MSADLLAAFGNPEVRNDGSKGNSTSKVSHASPPRSPEDTWQPWPLQSEQVQAPHQKIDEDDELWMKDEHGKNVLFDAEDVVIDRGTRQDIEDDFGDFEDAEADTPTKIQSFSLPLNTNNRVGTLLDLDGDGCESADATNQPRPTLIDTIRKSPITDFALYSIRNAESSAVSTDENDDWTNFEDVENASIASTGGATLRASPRRSVVDARLKQPVLMAEPPKQAAKASTTVSYNSTITDDDFDAWDDFEDGVPAVQAPTESESQMREPERVAQITKKPTVSRERPINVPPPSVLLSLCTKVWAILAAQARQSQNVEDVGVAVLRMYRVSARIISGRAQRWKRDTILAQSMRIGAAGRSGGMKLTAVDKGESRKEDQEAEEAISSWTRVSHILNAAMTKAKIQKPPISLSTKLVARAATGPGVLNANHVCPICGLKRTERVNGIDVDVSDTFGEFWIEQWGHSDCCLWWEQYSPLLEQR